MADIAVFILTYNEALHIERCIRALQTFAANVFVVDSHSTDDTVKRARNLGASVVQHVWENNHARQTNWAIDNLPMTASWIMRVDADEIVTDELAQELNAVLSAVPDDVNGFVLKRRQVFLGHQLRWGGNYPIRLLRIFRRGHGRCEDRWMDEHLIVTSGRTIELKQDLEDRNLNDLRWWTAKQANYAVREAADTLLSAVKANDANEISQNRRRKLWLKEHVYRRAPRFSRPLLYFFYRYVFRLGFLDGLPGLIWHVLQGFWYRFLVDAVIYEVESRSHENAISRAQVLKEVYGLKLQDAP